jgi:hypothetical protein
LIVMTLLGAAVADVPTEAVNPYQVIVDRNPFGLRPPPQPPTNAPPPAKPPTTNIKFTGITYDGKIKRAWLVLSATNYVDRVEGEEVDGIKIVKIDEIKSVVEVMQGGNLIPLTFETHGLAPSKVAAAGAPPGAAPGAVAARPAGQLGGPVVVGRGGVVSTGATTGAPSIQPITSVPVVGQTSASATPADALRQIPTRAMRTLPAQSPVNIPINTEAQYLIMQADAAAQQSAGRPMPPVPPLPGERQAVPMPPTP